MRTMHGRRDCLTEDHNKLMRSAGINIAKLFSLSGTVILFYVLFIVPASAQVTVVKDSLSSTSIDATSAVNIVLPDGYRTSNDRYSTMYLLHGFNGDQSSWIINSRLIEFAKQFRLIIVCFDAKNSWYANSYSQPFARYEDLLVKDIIPYIDKRYRTHAVKQHRSVCGLSMGGYGAIKYGLKYPEMFGFAAGISSAIQFPAGLEDSAIVARRSAASNASVRSAFGALRNSRWNENDVFFLARNADTALLPYFYLSAGSQDGIPEVVTQMHELAGIFRIRKIAFEMHESPGAHDWLFWNSELQTVLSKLPVASRP